MHNPGDEIGNTVKIILEAKWGRVHGDILI